MDAIRVRNLRSLSDTGYLPLKNLNLLVGRNSSGKSTFLRLFPLLRQSVEVRTTGPLLWYGDYVDFGDFSDAIRTTADSDSITLGFEFSLSAYSGRQLYFGPSSQLSPDFGLLEATSIKSEIELTSGHDKSTWLRSAKLEFADHTIELAFSETGAVETFRVNELEVLDIGGHFVALGTNGVLPIIAEEEQQESSSGNFFTDSSIGRQLERQVTPHFHGNTSISTIRNVVRRFRLGRSRAMLRHMSNLSAGGNYWQEQVSALSPDSRPFKRIRDLTLAAGTSSLFQLCDSLIRRFAQQVTYIAPLRATAQRYYRTQGLAVDEVDYEGRNIGMFLRSLDRNERSDFQDWLLEYFDISVRHEMSGGHLSVRVSEGSDGPEFNLADVGFGVSQLLPVVAQIWAHLRGGRRSYRRRTSLITTAIEQPELHLHPSLQARLADMLVDAVQAVADADVDLRMVVETHSETIINRIGSRLYNEGAASENIQVLLFEKDELGNTAVRRSSYDSDGYLSDWPFGFFEPDPRT